MMKLRCSEGSLSVPNECEVSREMLINGERLSENSGNFSSTESENKRNLWDSPISTYVVNVIQRLFIVVICNVFPFQLHWCDVNCRYNPSGMLQRV
jgi:hypothetical protein